MSTGVTLRQGFGNFQTRIDVFLFHLLASCRRLTIFSPSCNHFVTLP